MEYVYTSKYMLYVYYKSTRMINKIVYCALGLGRTGDFGPREVPGF
jgi:hypothetical protein